MDMGPHLLPSEKQCKLYLFSARCHPYLSEDCRGFFILSSVAISGLHTSPRSSQMKVNRRALVCSWGAELCASGPGFPGAVRLGGVVGKTVTSLIKTEFTENFSWSLTLGRP